ncbi:10102_t:CDS:2 [Ambispora gerdemannii]|uniref:10102_t:CDS:1 n=1 Tax=Ambispora gerdemannii TaxID=144530 RepID=A0A9N9FST0_9GLOM|nr:10102_t:CDS:2 [Ambispora gerdemannii]
MNKLLTLFFGRSRDPNVIVDNIRDRDITNNNDKEETRKLSNALKNLLEQFSSITNPGGQDEHLLECVQNWILLSSIFGYTI